MNIVRGTIQEWTSLDKIRQVFEKKCFEDIEEDELEAEIEVKEED